MTHGAISSTSKHFDGFFTRNEEIVAPSTYSIEIAAAFSSSMKSKIRTMFGCVSIKLLRVSRFKSSWAEGSKQTASGTSLSATKRSSRSSRASQTTPIPPRPRTFWRVKRLKSFVPPTTPRLVWSPSASSSGTSVYIIWGKEQRVCLRGMSGTYSACWGGMENAALAAWLDIGDRQFPLVGKTFSLGRAKDNNVVFTSPKVSRRHALVHAQGGSEFSLVDLGSSNGTHLNGRRVIQPIGLHHGDVIQIVEQSLIFHLAMPRTPEEQLYVTEAKM